MDHQTHADGATIQPSRDIECKKDPGFTICTGRMRGEVFRVVLLRRRRRTTRERTHHVAYSTAQERHTQALPV